MLSLARTAVAASAVAVCLAISSLPAAAEPGFDVRRDLTFTPIAPCRIVDTRVYNRPLDAGESRPFLARTAGGSVSQGGTTGSCGDVGMPRPAAVAITITIVHPADNGYATVHQYGTPRPLAATLAYVAGVVDVTSVSAIVTLPDDYSDPSPMRYDFALYSSASAHYVIDLVGFFAPPEMRPPWCWNADRESIVIPPGKEGSVVSWCANRGADVSLQCGQVEEAPRTLALTEVSVRCAAYNFGSEPRTLFAESRCCLVPGGQARVLRPQGR